jgi:hypothetical protein
VTLVSKFSGGITNSGVVTGATGIFLTAPGVSIFDSGTITGAGTAIRFGAGPNTLTLAPGFVINGTVVGSGGDTFQLGGTGAGAFNAALLGSQYQGFNTYMVSRTSARPRPGAPGSGGQAEKRTAQL